MKSIKIPVHSLIDLITNSSTEIYTFSDGSLKACEEMIDEMLQLFDVDKTCNDVFDLKIVDADYETEYFGTETSLVITPKDPKYDKLANLISTFLYSTHHEACYNG